MTNKVNENYVGSHNYISPEKFINYSDIVKDYGDVEITHEYIFDSDLELSKLNGIFNHITNIKIESINNIIFNSLIYNFEDLFYYNKNINNVLIQNINIPICFTIYQRFILSCVVPINNYQTKFKATITGFKFKKNIPESYFSRLILHGNLNTTRKYAKNNILRINGGISCWAFSAEYNETDKEMAQQYKEYCILRKKNF